MKAYSFNFQCRTPADILLIHDEAVFFCYHVTHGLGIRVEEQYSHYRIFEFKIIEKDQLKAMGRLKAVDSLPIIINQDIIEEYYRNLLLGANYDFINEINPNQLLTHKDPDIRELIKRLKNKGK